MKNSKNKFALIFSFGLIFSGCQTTKPFEIKVDKEKELNIISTGSNRVVQECYFLNAEKENKWRHTYLIHILDQKNEVITAMYPITLDKQAYTDHLKKVEKVLKQDGKVKLCVRDNLEKDNRTDPNGEIVDFGPLGKHSSPYGYLTFDRICNSKECVSISDTWTYTCPEYKSL